MLQDGEFEEDDDDAWQNQQISKGAGRQNSTAPSSQAAFGGRQAKDVFSAAPGARAASGDAASAGPERAVAAGAQVVASLRAGMEQLQVGIYLLLFKHCSPGSHLQRCLPTASLARRVPLHLQAAMAGWLAGWLASWGHYTYHAHSSFADMAINSATLN